MIELMNEDTGVVLDMRDIEDIKARVANFDEMLADVEPEAIKAYGLPTLNVPSDLWPWNLHDLELENTHTRV